MDAPQDELDELKYMKRFLFSNIIVNNEELDKNSLFLFTGIPGHNIEDVQIRGVHFASAGGGTKEDAKRRDIPQLDLNSMKHHWPEYRCFGGALPASAIYARYVDGLVISDFTAEFVNEEARPILYTDSVERLRTEGVERK